MLSVEKVLELANALEGVPLLSCADGGAAQRAGMVFGDILLRVNGQRVRSVVDYLRAKSLDRSHMQVVAFRAGRELVFELELDPPFSSVASARGIS